MYTYNHQSSRHKFMALLWLQLCQLPYCTGEEPHDTDMS